MSKPDDVPERAWDIAIAIETGYEGGEAGRRPQFIARALVAAEQRGIERAAKVAEAGYWSSALGVATGAAVAAAIRRIGDAR